jgi:methylglyoxal reductase
VIPAEQTMRGTLGAIGLGTFALGGVFGVVDAEGARATVLEHVQSGGRYLETAPSYPRASVDLGALIGELSPDRYVLATKCGTACDARGRIFTSGERAHLRRQVETELLRLNVDHFDVLQLHHVPQDVELLAAARVLDELRAEGVAKMIGLSNVSTGQLATVCAELRVDLVQNRLSVVHDEGHDELAELCARTGTVLNPYQAIERGLLSGDAWQRFSPRDGDLRSSKPEYVGRPAAVIRDWYRREMLPIAERHGLAPEHLAVGWVLRQPVVACCVLGARRPEQASRWLSWMTPRRAWPHGCAVATA